MSHAGLLSNGIRFDEPRCSRDFEHMAGPIPTDACAAHCCLRPRWKDAWCHAHWHAYQALVPLNSDAENVPESLAICEAIWSVS